jgi:hypothetical protein
MNGFLSIRDLFLKSPRAVSPSLLGYLTGEAPAVSEIARGAGQHETQFRAAFYSRDEGLTNRRGVRILMGSVPPAELRTQSHAVCPSCVDEGSIKAVHDLEIVDACPYHSILTKTDCPQCKQALSWTSASLFRCGSCEYDLRTIAKDEIDASGAKAILSFLRAGDSSSIRRVSKLLVNMRFSTVKSAEDRNSLLNAATQIVLEAPGGIESELLRISRRHPGFTERMVAAHLLALEDPVIAEQTRLALEKAPPTPSQSCEGCHCKSKTFTSTEALKVCGVSKQPMGHLVKSGHLKTRKGMATREIVYEANSLCELFQSLKPIEQSGLAVENCEPLVPNRPGDSSLIKRLELVRSGAVKVVRMDPRKGLRSIYTTPHGVESVEAIIAPNLIDVSEAATLMEVYPDAIRRVMKAGVLRPAKVKLARSRVAIDRVEFEIFQKNYVFVGPLAKLAGSGRTVFSAKLASEGIHPVSGPKIDGGLVALYRWSDLASVDLQAVAAKTEFESRAGRKKGDQSLVDNKQWVSTEEVAKTLKQSIQQITRLVRPRLLSVGVPKGREHDNTRYFTQESLIATAEWMSSAVAIEAVAKQLSTTVFALQLRFERSGFADFVSVGGKRLIGANDIKRIRAHREMFCTCAEADRFHGAPEKHFSNLVSTGRIKAVPAMKAEGIKSVTLLSWSDVREYRVNVSQKSGRKKTPAENTALL